LGEDSSVLKSKECFWFHSITYRPKRAWFKLVKQDKSQGSLYWTGPYAKEHSLGEGKQTPQERASRAETTTIGIQDCYWSYAGRSKNQIRESHQ